MRLLVIGAGGGLGRDVVAEALAGGHETAAPVRDPGRVAFPHTVKVVRGDVLDPPSRVPAVAGVTR